MNIDVIIVNYNAGQLLLECVQSVLKSTVPVNILISNNGEKVTGSFTDSRVHVTENNANLGFSKGNNRVLEQAKSEYILFLNPDCMIQPDTLKQLLKVMEADVAIGMVGPVIRNLDGSEQRGCRRRFPTPLSALKNNFNRHQEPLPKQPIDVEAISGAFMLVRRSALDTVGPWDEDYFLHCEDLDLCMRFHLAGFRIVFVPTVSVLHIKGACSSGRPLFVQWHMHKGMVQFYRKFYQDKYPWLLMWVVFAGIW
ncbi:MAG: glycosyltransferase family 2 protein, partial [Gammaproteobacteria bacterium]